jgi:hypothetical protein
MSPPRSRDAGLVELLMDTLGADEPPLEWLVRYAQDPASLGREEREQVERKLADSAVYREELRALQRLAVTPAAPAPVAVRAPSLAARAREWFSGLFEFQGAGWGLAAAAAAALVLALYTVLWRAPGDAGTGPVVAQRPEPPVPAAVPEPAAPPVRAQTPGEPLAPPESAPEPARPPARPAPILLAMATPAYVAPEGAYALGTQGGIIRGAGAAIGLRALAPGHAGLSATPSPELFWFLDALPPRGSGSFELIVQDPESPDPLLTAELEVSEPGLQRVSLAGRGVALAPSVDYAWSIAFRTDPAHPSRDPFARGWVRYAPAPAALGALPPGEAPRALAAAGYWYDALAAVQRARDAQPDNASVRAAWDALLASAELEVP